MCRIALIAFILLFSCSGRHSLLISNRLVSNVEIFLLPFDMTTRVALKNELLFDEASIDYKKKHEQGFLARDVYIGKELSEYKHLDIRAKIIITDNTGFKTKLFFSGSGLMMFEDKIYKAPESIQKLLLDLNHKLY